jgi:alpha-galactosidase
MTILLTRNRPPLAQMCLAILGACSGTFGHAATSQPPHVHSDDTDITLEAGERAPRLVRLRVPGGGVWENRTAEVLPAQVEIHGTPRKLVWQLDRAASRSTPREIEFVYDSDTPHLRLSWRWRARGKSGPLEHEVQIENLAGEDVWLPLQDSLRFDWEIQPQAKLQRFWVEKGADTPGPVGIHVEEVREGESWQGSSSTYARPVPGEPREFIPYLLVEEPGGMQRGWYAGIEFSGRTRISLRRSLNSLAGEAGLNPLPGPYRTRLVAGGAILTPTVFIGGTRGGPDGAGNTLRRWVREVLNAPAILADPRYPLMVSNSWGSGMAVDDALARQMIRQAQKLGLEMFHLDAGWFRAVGDWHPDEAKFPHGLASLAQYAHEHGLRFGLWVDWTQAGTSAAPGARNVFNQPTRDWLIADPPLGWKHSEPFKGITIDLSVPAAQAFAQTELERIVSEYHLDMLEHDGYLVAQGSARADHPAAAPEPRTLRIHPDSGYLWVEGSNSTDVSDRATRAYYAVYEALRARHPQLLLEICNDGGRMVDFGSAAHGDYFSITDTYDPLSNRRAFFDASYVLPPAMLESYVAQGAAEHIENFRYQLRSGMLGWFSLMQDVGKWSEAQRADARVQFALYRDVLRPLIRSAELYHVSARPDGVGWDGIEYYARDTGAGVLYAFHGTSAADPEHRFRLLGLEPESSYKVRSHDGGIAASVLSGRQLMQRGLLVHLPLSESSDLIFLEKIASRAPSPASPP